MFDPTNEFPYIRRCIIIMTFPMENREQGSECVSGVPRLFAVPLRLGLVNAPPGDDVTDVQLLLCRVKYCGHKCINGT